MSILKQEFLSSGQMQRRQSWRFECDISTSLTRRKSDIVVQKSNQTHVSTTSLTSLVIKTKMHLAQPVETAGAELNILF